MCTSDLETYYEEENYKGIEIIMVIIILPKFLTKKGKEWQKIKNPLII